MHRAEVSQTAAYGGPVQTHRPLVTIGIPAYNRAAELARAARSALTQDHGAVEVLISDDASTNSVVAPTGRGLARVDERVRYVRQPHNLGHAGNYQWVLENARGEFFMWLSDDDWLDPQYVGRCLRVLQDDPGTRLVCGLGRYHRDGVHVVDERPTDLVSARPGTRVVRHFARVSLNGALFGVARRSDLLAVGFPQAVGGDWLLVAAMAAQGRVRTVPDVHIHRSLSGLSDDAGALARSFGMTGIAARSHHAFFAGALWRDLVSGRGPLASLAPWTRLWVASASAACVVVRFTLGGLVRSLLGHDRAGRLEAWISARLRARDGARDER
jgi:hypothetical protein